MGWRISSAEVLRLALNRLQCERGEQSPVRAGEDLDLAWEQARGLVGDHSGSELQMTVSIDVSQAGHGKAQVL